MSENLNSASPAPPPADGGFKAPSLPVAKSKRYGLLLPDKPPQQPSDTPIATTSTADVAPTPAPAPVQTGPIVFQTPEGSVPLAYEPPFWSASPSHPYFFEEIKEGKIENVHQAHDKGFYLIGRAPYCDIGLEHLTISRQHAIVQFRKTGEAYLFDLGSAHGTFVNKKPVRPKVYLKLRNGDQLSFGQSTRVLFLQGGEDQQEEPVKVSTAEKKTAPELSEAGAKEKADKIAAAKKRRRDAIESAEIKKAQADELAAVAWKEKERKRAQKIAAGMDEDDALDSDDEGIDQNFYKEYYGNEDDDEDDEFYDRTASKSKKAAEKNSAPAAETFDSLSAKKVVLEHQLRGLQAEIDALKVVAESKKKTEEVDELDSFMTSLSSSVEEEKIGKKKKLIEELTKELQRVSKMAEIAKPAPSSFGPIKVIENSDALVDSYMRELTKKRKETDFVQSLMAPPPAKRQKVSAQSTPSAPPEQNSTAPSEGPKDAMDVEATPSAANGEKQKPAFAAPMAPIAAKKKAPKKAPEKPTYEDTTKYDEWVPPVDQAGDGTTNLNAKLGY